jgi:hypothetical protein
MVERKEHVESMISSQIKGYMKSFLENAKSSVPGKRASILLDGWAEDQDTTIGHVIDGFCEMKQINAMNLKQADMEPHRELVRIEIDKVVDTIKEETKNRFWNYFDRRAYNDLDSDLSKRASEKKEVSITWGPAQLSLEETYGRPDAMKFLLKEFSEYVFNGTDDSNAYRLRADQLSFLEESAEELLDKLSNDAKQKST